MQTHVAVRAKSVTSAIGIHTDHAQGNHGGMVKLVEQARYAGTPLLRMVLPVGKSAWLAPEVDQLIQPGMLGFFGPDTETSPEENVGVIASYAKRFPGFISFVGGPNEPNNWGVNYGGKTGVEGAILYQSAFYAAMKANPATARIPVAGMSSWPSIASKSDWNNLHFYASDGNQPGARLADELSRQNAVDPGKPFVVTETGYYTLPGTNKDGVDLETQAKLLLNTYFSVVAAGAKALSFYAMRDWWGSDDGAHFGLFYNDNSPKPAAVALHNVAAILTDAGATAATFRLYPFTYDLAASGDVKSLLMRKSTGEFVLALWREPDIWDAVKKKPVVVDGVTASLTFPSTVDLAVHDALLSPRPLATVLRSRRVDVTVTDHPVLVTIRT